jgi:hypothetical protein
MKKGGLGDSPFFDTPQQVKEAISSLPVIDSEKKENKKPKVNEPKKEHSINRDTMIPSNHDTMTPRYQEIIVETVRKAVKEFGKEAATHRFTPDEKRKVADIIYTYKTTGIRTSENEITRIAVNYLIEDYEENGENSILDKILKALNG